MQSLKENDILTKISRYNLIRNERLIYIDVHETKAGKLAGKFVAVPNLINIVARQEFQGTGETEDMALENCLQKIRDFEIEDLFPKKNGIKLTRRAVITRLPLFGVQIVNPIINRASQNLSHFRLIRKLGGHFFGPGLDDQEGGQKKGKPQHNR
jgi:hypothetical protein